MPRGWRAPGAPSRSAPWSSTRSRRGARAAPRPRPPFCAARRPRPRGWRRSTSGGRALSSPALADLLAHWRDEGARDAAFLIGGADGLEAGLRTGADLVLGLGPMVWPHKLVRVMIAEQLYRAVSILAGTPYHRE